MRKEEAYSRTYPFPRVWPEIFYEQFLFQDVTTTPQIELSRQFWKVAEMVESSDRAVLEEAVKMLDNMVGRYEDMERDRALAATKVLRAQALKGINKCEVRSLVEEALAVLDEKLDREMIARARGLVS